MAAKWIYRPPTDPLIYQPDQQEFLEARRIRYCLKCRALRDPSQPFEFTVQPPTFRCPLCGDKGVRKFDYLTIIAGRRYGKDLALDTPIPTPDGWTTMGALQVGSLVFDANGLPTKVTAVSPIFIGNRCWKLTFSDDTEIVAGEDHQWLTWNKSARKALGKGRRINRAPKRSKWGAQAPRAFPSVVTTREISETLRINSKNECNHAIKVCGYLQYPEQNLPLDPYTLGVWLGDGSKGSGTVWSVDQEIYENIRSNGITAECRVDRLVKLSTIVGRGFLVSQLRELGVLKNKHVPRAYLEASPEQRLALLQGLMDTDGTCDKSGHCEFTNKNIRLSEAVYELATSLGIKPGWLEGRATLCGKDCGPKYRVLFTTDVPVFKLSRKLARLKPQSRLWTSFRYIVSAEEVESVPTRCIEVDSPSHLFLASKACIPTHNSKFGSIAGAEEACIPNTIGWACAPTVPKLHHYVIPAFEQLIPTDWVVSWNKDLLDLRLKNGSLIHFQTLDDPDQGRGQGLDWLWIDEICELTLKHWEVISPSLDDKRGVAFFTTSPRSYDWVYEEFYYPAEAGMSYPAPGRDSRPVSGFWALHARTADNPIFQTPAGQARLAAKKAQMSDLMYRQEYEADFVTFEDAIYGETLTKDRILYTDDEMKLLIPEWPSVDPWRTRLVGLDTGADHPFGATLMVSTDSGGFVVIGEYLERNKTFLEHALNIRRMVNAPTAKYAINKNERQALLELGQHDIWPQKAQNDVVAGIERVRTWLHNKQLWFFAPRCPKTVQQMKAYRWAENESAKDQQKRNKEQVYKKNDELPDCCRYSLMTWPILPVRPAPDEAKRDLSSLDPEIQTSIQRMRRIDQGMIEQPDSVTGDFWSS